MILQKTGEETYAFALTDSELATIAKSILRGNWRIRVYKGKFIGVIEFRTMEFRPFDRVKMGVESIKITEEQEVAIVEDEVPRS